MPPLVRTAALSAALLFSATAMDAGAAPPHSTVDWQTVDWSSLPLPAIDGGTLSPALFQGRAVLVVNTASQCGYTGQYAGLQKLWSAYRDRGLVVLGVPSNDFGAQEPGGNAQVASFCELNYGVDFPLLEKQTVVGPDAHPFYRWAAGETGPTGVPRWNFHKILIGRDGRLAATFPSAVTPDAPALASAIDQALAQPASSSPVAGQ